MIEKRIEVCIGTDRSGGIRVRLSLLLIDGEQVIHEHFHSAMLLPGEDPAELRRVLETALAKPNAPAGGSWPAIPDAEWAKVTGVMPIFHTAEKIAAQAALKSRRPS